MSWPNRQIRRLTGWSSHRYRQWFQGDILFILSDYWTVSTGNEKRHDLLLPLIGAIVVVSMAGLFGSVSTVLRFFPVAASAVAIMAGFSLTSLTIFLSSASEQLTELKSRPSGRMLGRENIDCYRLMYVNLNAALKGSFIALVPLACVLVLDLKDAPLWVGLILAGMGAYCFFVPLAISIRNATNMYHVFFRHR